MKKLSFLILPLLLASLACQAVMGTPQPSPTPTPIPRTHTPTPLPPTSTDTPLPTSTHTATPSATPPATLTATITPTASPFQQQVFDELWQTIDENYLYEDFNGLDWAAIYDEYNQKIAGGLSDADFYAAMHEMVERLGDEHSTFFTPEEAKEEDASYAGDYNFVGIGIMTFPVLERGLITIIAIFPDSPAEEAGLHIHDSILAVEGQPVLDENGYRQDLLLGLEGSSMTITVQTPGEEARQLTITRRRVTGSLPVFNEVLPTPTGKRIGYMLLTTFGDSSVDEQVRQALQDMNAETPLDGLILDNRVNGGGYSDVVENIFSLFTGGTLGHFISREGRDPLEVRKKGIAGSQDLPLVVMVGEGTASFGEIFSGVLQDLGRAYIIGELTDGNVEILYVYEFSDGSRAWIAHDSFRPLNHPEQNWEKTGIQPDLVVPSQWDQVTVETDPAVQAALEYFDQ